MEDSIRIDLILQHGNPLLRLALVMFATFSGAAMIARDSRVWRMSPWHRIGLIVTVALCGLLGSAVPAFLAGGYVQEVALHTPIGPKTVLGGILFGFFGATIYKRALGIRCETSDAFARGTALMMAIGRLGCVAQHCCFGRSYMSPVSVDLGDGVQRFPVQLLEALCLFGLFGVLQVMHRRQALENRRLFFLFATYGAIRFLLEYAREPIADPIMGGLSFYQGLAAFAILVGVVQLFKRSRCIATTERIETA